jgi:hypothetical protein
MSNVASPTHSSAAEPDNLRLRSASSGGWTKAFAAAPRGPSALPVGDLSCAGLIERRAPRPADTGQLDQDALASSPRAS